MKEDKSWKKYLLKHQKIPALIRTPLYADPQVLKKPFIKMYSEIKIILQKDQKINLLVRSFDILFIFEILVLNQI